MKSITNIKQISSNKYVLTIDSKKHIVYDDVLLEYNILKKCDISDEVYNKIVSANNYHEAYNKMLKYITAKLRTEKEVRKKLSDLLIKKEDQDKIVGRLKKEKYLDEHQYIKSFINDNVLLTLNGPKKIIFDLRKKEFSDNIINLYLDEIDENIWLEKAKKIVDKKLKSNRGLSQKMLIFKLKKDFNTLGYDEIYYNHLLEGIHIDESQQMKKDYQKVYNKLSRKYSGDKLNLLIKQKLYQLGYDLSKIDELQ